MVKIGNCMNKVYEFFISCFFGGEMFSQAWHNAYRALYKVSGRTAKGIPKTLHNKKGIIFSHFSHPLAKTAFI